MKLVIELARLVRQTKVVYVEVPDDLLKPGVGQEAELRDLMQAAYEEDEGDDFALDCNWDCEEGTHALLAALRGPYPKPINGHADRPAQFILRERGGEVETVK